MALLVPTKAFLQMSPDMAILFAPFWCTNPSFPITLFPLMQNLSSKDIAGSGIMKLRVLRYVIGQESVTESVSSYEISQESVTQSVSSYEISPKSSIPNRLEYF